MARRIIMQLAMRIHCCYTLALDLLQQCSITIGSLKDFSSKLHQNITRKLVIFQVSVDKHTKI